MSEPGPPWPSCFHKLELTLLHAEWPRLFEVLAPLSATGPKESFGVLAALSATGPKESFGVLAALSATGLKKSY